MNFQVAGGDIVYVYGKQRCVECGRIDWLYYPVLDHGLECEVCGEMKSYPFGPAYSVEFASVEARCALEKNAFLNYKKYRRNYN